VVRGRDFLEEMERQGSASVDDAWWVNGFPLSRRFIESVEEAEILPRRIPEAVSVLYLHSDGLPSERDFPDSWTKRPGGWEEVVTDDPSDWNYLDEDGAILLPHGSIRAISLWFGRPGGAL
jgi:hypothetical protein